MAPLAVAAVKAEFGFEGGTENGRWKLVLEASSPTEWTLMEHIAPKLGFRIDMVEGRMTLTQPKPVMSAAEVDRRVDEALATLNARPKG